MSNETSISAAKRAAARGAPADFFALGCVASLYIFPKLSRAATITAFAVAASASAIHFIQPRVHRTAWSVVLCVSAGLVFGAAAEDLRGARRAVFSSGKIVLTGYGGVLLRDSRLTKGGNRVFDLRLDSIKVAGARAKGEISWPKHRLSATLLSGPGPALDAGTRVDAARISTLDADRSLHFADSRYLGFTPPSGFLPEARARFRAAAIGAIGRVAGKSFPLAQALLLGIKDELDGDVSSLFTSAGCAHILALSGQHLSILCALASLLVSKIFGKPSSAGAVSFAFAFVFVWVAGASPSLLRAVVMLAFAQASKILGRPQKSISILSLSFIFCVGCDPESAETLSFQLSYCAMAGLIALSQRWRYALEKFPPLRTLRPLSYALSASLAALCATAPISIGAFGSVSSGGIFAATVSAPLILAFMWSIIGSATLAQWSDTLSRLFSAAHGALYDLILAAMRIGSRFPSLGGAAGYVVVCLGIFVYALPYLDSARSAVPPLPQVKITILPGTGADSRKRRKRGEPRVDTHTADTTLNYDSPLSVKAYLDASGLATTKRFGQNFLVDHSARSRIFESIQAAEGTSVWEIGPGLGSITSLLLEAGCSVTAFEVDYGFSRSLRAFWGTAPRFTLIEGDFLKTWKSAAPLPARIFGNLPYNSALAIIADLLESGMIADRMVFTVQKEAAQRMAAGPGTKDYSAFSVLCASACSVKVLFDIGASSFWPRPKVTSSLVAMTPRRDPLAASDRLGFSNFVRSAFASRRKMLKNNLQSWAARPRNGAGADSGPGGGAVDLDRLASALEKIGAPPGVRAEALSPEQLLAVYSELVYSK